jgi:carbon monoxide dehydrogenase subunit G
VEIKNSFEVPVGVDGAWIVLTDVERVAKCMPGAELTDVSEDGAYRGKVKVKVGPISLAFAGEARFDELDEAAKRMKLKAKGREMRGRGAAEASVVSELSPSGDSATQVVITTDLQLSGAVAQYGRNMLSDVSTHLVGQFADCLRSQLSGTGEEAEMAISKAEKGVPGIRLFLKALWNAVKRLFGRLLGRSKSDGGGGGNDS